MGMKSRQLHYLKWTVSRPSWLISCSCGETCFKADSQTRLTYVEESVSHLATASQAQLGELYIGGLRFPPGPSAES